MFQRRQLNAKQTDVYVIQPFLAEIGVMSRLGFWGENPSRNQWNQEARWVSQSSWQLINIISRVCLYFRIFEIAAKTEIFRAIILYPVV